MKWRTHTTWLLVGGALVIIIASGFAYVATHFQKTVEVRLGSGVYNLQIARDSASQEKGLSGVESLRPDGGLLMVFDRESNWQIWMKDMKIPIDIVWLDSNKKVVDIVQNASPDAGELAQFAPKKPALYVVELAAGSVKQSGIRLNEVAIFALDDEAGN